VNVAIRCLKTGNSRWFANSTRLAAKNAINAAR